MNIRIAHRLVHSPTRRSLVLLAAFSGIWTAAARNATAAEPDTALLEIRWKERAAAGLITNGDVIEVEQPYGHALRVASPAEPGKKGPHVVLLASVEAPAILKPVFALSGSVRHKGIEGTAYLEMWTVFPDTSQYFTRTLAAQGPMRSLRGDSDWRPITLPFQLGENAPARPARLILNVVFDGAGEIELTDLKLTEADHVTGALSPGTWWSDQTGGLVGGIVGTLFGLAGGAAGILISLGRARRFVMAGSVAAMLIGPIVLITGLVALGIGQPYAVYYPLLLLGVLSAVAGAIGWYVGRNAYAQRELRKIQALDA